jgi:putative heme-binding domain-containing protein
MKRLTGLTALASASALSALAALPAHAADSVVLSTLDLSLGKQGWRTPAVDKSVEGNGLAIGGVKFANGFGTHADSDLVVDLKGGGEAFTAKVGVDDETTGDGSVEFFVIGDDKILWRSGVLRGREEAVKVNVKLKGVKLLRLHVSDGGDGNGKDHADWADAKIAYAGEKPMAIPLGELKALDFAVHEVGVKNFMSRLPKGYTATLFAHPPEVSYPVCVAASGKGELFISVDKNGSLDREKHRGSIVRATDTDGDGVADKFDTFVADVDSPRGIFFDGDTLYCLHPPTLTAYRDTDGDAKADQVKDIITGIGYGFDMHPADHTSNGIRQAIDGWIYCAIGDFGIPDGVGTDGKHMTMRGGGVVRLRPDGSELEVYAHHTRNIMDVSVDPYLNGFIYDNTNDGDGWNSRFSYFLGGADMGYPSLYARFGNELLPTLHDFGGGSAVGSIFLHEPGLASGDGEAEFTCDWGTGTVYRMPLKADGAGWALDSRDEWAKVQSVTDMDADGNSHLFVSSWKGAVFTYNGPSVGAIIELRPVEGGEPAAKFPDLKKASDAELVPLIAARSAVCRQQTQDEMLRRGAKAPWKAGLLAIAKAQAQPLYARIAALFTFKSLFGADANPDLVALAGDATIQEWALRALADRKTQLANVPLEPFVQGLGSDNPRVRVQALVGLLRLGKPEAGKAIVPLLAVKPEWKDAQLVIPHMAVRALVELNAVDATLAAVSTGAPSDLVDGALWALRWMHDERAVKGLVGKLANAPADLKKKIYTDLARLYYSEGEWDRKAWWTTRPEHTGPYYQRATWAGSGEIEAALKAGIAEGGEVAEHITAQVEFLKLKIEGIILAGGVKKPDNQNDADILAKAKANAAKQAGGGAIGTLSFEDVVVAVGKAKGDPKKGQQLFAMQGCIACHTISKDVPQKGPYLGEITKQYSRAQLTESVLRPSAVISQGFTTRWFDMKDGTHQIGFVTHEGAETIELRNIVGQVMELSVADIVKRGEEPKSMMPEGLANNLQPEDLASIFAYFESVAAAAK